MSSTFQAYLKLIRVQQWVKNLFVFIPAFFGEHLLSASVLGSVTLGFLAFSCWASTVYIINDYVDIEKDKLHPQKRNRPLASGKISKKAGGMLALVLLATGSLIIYYLDNFYFLGATLAYLVLNLLYSFKLKQIAIIDITVIAVGFLLRIIGGGFLGGVVLSKWIIMMSFLLALFLALGKRRDDIVLLNQSGVYMRKSLEGYNLEFINAAMVFMSSVIVVAYIMYTVSDEVVRRANHDYTYLTSVFVILGILRYLQLTLVAQKSADPTKILLKDPFVLASVLLWLLSNFWMIYLL